MVDGRWDYYNDYLIYIDELSDGNWVYDGFAPQEVCEDPGWHEVLIDSRGEFYYTMIEE